MEYSIITLDLNDNVGVAVRPLQAGMRYAVLARDVNVLALDNIAFGHKVALADLENNAAIIKYGEVIAHAAGAIHAGSHVHIHNMHNTVE